MSESQDSKTTIKQNLAYTSVRRNLKKSLWYTNMSTMIKTGVRPEDQWALASESRCRQSCYSFNICKVQCNSSLRATRQIELAMHRAISYFDKCHILSCFIIILFIIYSVKLHIKPHTQQNMTKNVPHIIRNTVKNMGMGTTKNINVIRNQFINAMKSP